MHLSFRHFLLIAIAAVLAWFSYTYKHQAFPELSPEFSQSREQIEARSDELAGMLGFNPRTYQHAMVFDERSLTKYFFELEYGLDKLVEATKKGVHIWSWHNRYYLADEQAELKITLDTEGRLTGVRRVIPETKQLPEISEDDARQLALDFLRQYAPQHPQDQLNLTETGSEEDVGYTTHKFTWERKDWQYGDAKYHLHVNVSGDLVSRYHEHVDVPEAWNREFRIQRSTNDLYQTIAGYGTSLIMILGIIMFVIMIRRHQIHWHGFAYFWLIPVALVFLLAGLSDFQSSLYYYSTNDDFNSYLADELLVTVISVISEVIMIAIIAFIADALWHKTFPERTPIRAILSGKGLATRECMNSVWLGFFVAIATTAYVTIYYMLGRDIGIWTPSEIDYSEVMTSHFPAFEALYVGISAAIDEEFLYRVIGIAVFYRITRNKWAAILISAAIWGFMHSNYPQLPGYARGIELTIEGAVLGWLAIRYGILTTLVSHCLYNTWLGIIVVWESSSPPEMALALLVSLWPLLLLWLGRYERKKLGRVPDNEELALGEPSLQEQIMHIGKLITPGQAVVSHNAKAVMGLIIAVVIALPTFLPIMPFEDLGKVNISWEDAQEKADIVFHDITGQDPTSYKRHTALKQDFNSGNLDYIEDQVNPTAIRDELVAMLYEDYWVTTYFRIQQRDKYIVMLDDQGELFLFKRDIADDTEGASLETEQAIELAEQHLQRLANVKPGEYRMVSHDMTQQKNRRDHVITFEDTRWNIGESHARWNIYLLGDQLNNFVRWIKIPEDYERLKSASGWKDTLQTLLSYTAVILLVIGILLTNVVLIMRHNVPWKFSFKLASLVPLTLIIVQFNNLPNFYTGYVTTQTAGQFLGSRLMDISLSIVGAYLLTVVMIGVLLGLLTWLSGINYRELICDNSRKKLWHLFPEGWYYGVTGVMMMFALSIIGDYVSLYINDTVVLSIEFADVTGFLPFITITGEAVYSSIFTALSNTIILLLVILFWEKHRWLLSLLIVLLLASINLEWTTLDDAVYGIVFQSLRILFMLWLFVRLFRYNPFAYLTFYYYDALLPATATMTQKAWYAYGTDVAALWVALFAPLLLVAFNYVRSRFTVDDSATT
jgi:hypothetical protein